jgi:hypothetical protein
VNPPESRLELGIWSDQPNDQDGSADTELGRSMDFVGTDLAYRSGGITGKNEGRLDTIKSI